MRRIAVMVWLLSLSSIAAAESPWSGTWVLREDQPGGKLTMKIEEANGGWKITYKVIGPGAPGASNTTILTPLDGKEVTVLIDGQPSEQTMAIRQIDSHHTINVIRFKGKEIGTSKAELGVNGKLVKVEIDYPESNIGAPAQKQIQYWDKK